MIMDILVNPNVAYMLLVVGIVMVIMALFAPGTGILELGAFFVLLLAGWEMTQLPINLWALGLLVLGVIPFILAVRKSHKMVYLVIALAAFIIGSIYLFQGEHWWQPGVNPILAVVTSILAGGYIWIAVTKVMETEYLRPQHGTSQLIGKIGEAKTDIFNEGSVQIESELWSAHSAVPIELGKDVRVVKIDGFILEVEPVSPKNE
jgi:membrane-bound serine protease (ClpP class)